MSACPPYRRTSPFFLSLNCAVREPKSLSAVVRHEVSLVRQRIIARACMFTLVLLSYIQLEKLGEGTVSELHLRL